MPIFSEDRLDRMQVYDVETIVPVFIPLFRGLLFGKLVKAKKYGQHFLVTNVTLQVASVTTTVRNRFSFCRK